MKDSHGVVILPALVDQGQVIVRRHLFEAVSNGVSYVTFISISS